MSHLFKRKTAWLIMVAAIGVVMLASAAFAQNGGENPPREPLQFDFTVYENNPVLARGAFDAWDGANGTIFAPHIVMQDDTYYLFYTGSDNRQVRPAAIGYATSTDGLNWEKAAANPILESDNEGFDALCVSGAVPLIDEDTWVLYYGANALPCYGPGPAVGRATAETPDGPWTRTETPVLEVGGPGEWDSGFIVPQSVLRTEDGYVMYYIAGADFLMPVPRLVGMATSQDGVAWQKYDDPATTEAPYAQSDPVVEVTAEGDTVPFCTWSGTVSQAEDGWEMFFSGTCAPDVGENCPAALNYAWSEDGIHWVKYVEDPPMLCPLIEQEAWASHLLTYPFAMQQDNGEYWLYYTGCTQETNDCEIGVAFGTISPVE